MNRDESFEHQSLDRSRARGDNTQPETRDASTPLSMEYHVTQGGVVPRLRAGVAHAVGV
jgi:hypothetical protein